MSENSYCLLLAAAFIAAGCAKTQTTTPTADASVDTAPSAGTPDTHSAAASPSTDSPVSAHQAEDAATSAAETWLSLIDQGTYGASWDTAAPLFQRALARDEWASKVASVRGPLGKLLSRQVQSAKFVTSLPGVPDGKYVVITFSTAFENRPHAIETVTPLQGERGPWRVAGYFIK